MRVDLFSGTPVSTSSAPPAAAGAAWSQVDYYGPSAVTGFYYRTTGVAFSVAVAGKTCTGVRFWKSSSGTKTYKVSLWNSAGTLLATASSSQTGAGAKTISFASSVALTLAADYRASVFETSGSEYAYVGAVVPQIMMPAAGAEFLVAAGYYSGPSYQVGDDNFPNSPYSGNERYPVEPVIA